MKSNFILLLYFTLPIVFSNCSNAKHPPGKDSVELYVRLRISGDWANADGLRIWRINADSIYYYDQKKAFPYRLDSLNFSVKPDNSDSFKYLGWVRVEKDTLFFTTTDSVLKLQRIR
jgi:hypothetical protein